MKCADVMNRNLEWLTEKDSVLKAATLMAEAGVGFLPICDVGKKVIGVVTDRDLTTRVIAKKIAPATTSAALVMSSPPLTCLETADLRDAEDLMIGAGKARLVITDAEGKLAGVLSLADLIEKAPGRKSHGDPSGGSLARGAWTSRRRRQGHTPAPGRSDRPQSTDPLG